MLFTDSNYLSGWRMTVRPRNPAHDARRPGTWRHTLWLALIVLGAAVALGHMHGPAAAESLAGAQVAQGADATDTWKPSRDQIREIQLRLKQLNFDPGAVDGSFGPRSAAALRAYQSSIGLKADGRLTEALAARLLRPDPPPEEAPDGAEPADPVEPVLSAPAVVPPDCSSAAMGLWVFQDEQGSRFQLGLLSGGAVEGPFYSRHWSWSSTGNDTVQIRYDNGMGVSVLRSGRLEADGSRMSGAAQDSRGNEWTWQAARVLDPDAGRDASCSPGVGDGASSPANPASHTP